MQDTINIKGETIKTKTIKQDDGTWGFYGVVGDDFDAVVQNKIKSPTVIHWHGLELPNKEDGTEITQTSIFSTMGYQYKYPLIHAGTYWMHSHEGFQEQDGVVAPFIVYPKNYDNKNGIVLLFEDFSYSTPEEIMKKLKTSSSHSSHHTANVGKMDMDLYDVDYDYFLTNHHILSDNPLTKEVKAGETYLLRLIDGSSMTNYWIDLGELDGKLIAVDANDIKPYIDNIFQLAVAQRMDIHITIPKDGGVFPILAKVEGRDKQTGIILYTKGKKIPKYQDSTELVTHRLNYSQEHKIHSTSNEFKNLTIDEVIDVRLSGSMKPYAWQINNQSWPNITPIQLKKGENVQFNFINESSMSHPMHIHGHFFKIISIDGKAIKDGAIRDTVLVQPNSTVSVVMKAERIGHWFMHCHMLYHMHTGMMTFINISDTKS